MVLDLLKGRVELKNTAVSLIPKLHYKVYGGKFDKVMEKVERRLLYADL